MRAAEKLWPRSLCLDHTTGAHNPAAGIRCLSVTAAAGRTCRALRGTEACSLRAACSLQPRLQPAACTTEHCTAPTRACGARRPESGL
eukprot:scaffold61673_cov69-Phaeocystis_antarctica.AAC.1